MPLPDPVPRQATVLQTMAGRRRPRHTPDRQRPARFPDTCHAHAGTSVMVREIDPNFYTGT